MAVVLYASEKVWVALKVVDGVLMVAFVMVQVMWLSAREEPLEGAP